MIENYYDWATVIELKTGDYAIDPDAETAFQKIRQKHPEARNVEMRLNEELIDTPHPTGEPLITDN